MTNLDVIKNTLETNKYLSNELKDNLFELIVVFSKEFPEITLDNLNDRLENLKIEKINSFLTKKVSKYDAKKNTIYFNAKELEKEYDARHLLMFELLNIISMGQEYNGFNFDSKFEALNIGYTEMLTNYLVGNNGEIQVCPHEELMANLFSTIVGDEAMKVSYFQNDYKLLLDSAKRLEVELAGKNGFMNWNALGNYYSKVNNWDQNKIQEIYVGMISNSELSKEQIEKISLYLVYNNACLGEKESFNNASIKKFDLIKDTIQKEPSAWIEETKQKIA